MRSPSTKWPSSPRIVRPPGKLARAVSKQKHKQRQEQPDAPLSVELSEAAMRLNQSLQHHNELVASMELQRQSWDGSSSSFSGLSTASSTPDRTGGRRHAAATQQQPGPPSKTPQHGL